MSIMRDGSQLSVERTTMPGINDTIFYHTSGLRKQQYSIKLIPENFRNGFEAVMHDRYQGMSWTINLSDSTEISFTVTDEAASAAPNRFMLVFNRQLPATNFGDEVSLPKENMFTVMPNPVTGKVLRLQFNNDEGGRYQVSLLSQSGQVVNSTSVFLNKGKSVQSLAVGNIPAGTYLLKVATAETIYTKVIVIL